MTDSIDFSIRDHSGTEFTFTSIESLESFISSEIEYWNEKQAQLGKQKSILPFIDGGRHLTSFYSVIRELKLVSEKTQVSDFNRQLNNAAQQHLRNISQFWISKTHSYIETYLRCYEQFQLAGAEAFLAYALGKQINNTNNKNVLSGAFAAYEFFDAPDEHIKRKTGEKISLSALRNEFKAAQDRLITDAESLKHDFKNWSERQKSKQVRRHKALKRLNRITNLARQKEVIQQQQHWEKEFKNLESVYTDKLKLEAPAKYWLDSAKKFKIQGVVSSVILLALISLGLISITSVLELWMLRGETPLSLGSIQGILLFGSLLGVFAFGARVISRLVFSSFHLMRDSEERHQLTYLYLSLINETESDPRAREIILQALFSRTETGLIASENGPTMPGLRDVVGNIKRSGP